MFFHKMREQMKIIIIIVVVAMAGGLLWAGGVSLFGGKNNVQPAQAAAAVCVVNGQAISYYDLYQTFINRLQQIEEEQGLLPGRAYEAVRFQALESLIGSVLISQEIDNRKLTASKAEIDQEYQNIVDQFPSVDDFKLQLQWAGLTEDILKARLAEEIKFDKLKQEIIGDIPVSDQEVREAYEQVRASHILISPETDTEEGWAEAEQKAQDIHAELTVDNFAEMAKLHSEDSSGEQGGDLGYIYRGRTVPEFEAAVFALAVDEISEPVRSMYGYHLITVTDRQEAEGEEFEKVRPLIENMIREEKGQEDLVAWYELLRANAEVHYTDHQMSAFNQVRLGNLEDAVHYYKLAIEDQPNDGYLYASLGDIYEELGQVDEAIAQYKLATEKFSTDFSLYMALGQLYEQADQIDEAVEAYLKSSELAPNDIFAQLSLYSYVNRLERYDEAKIIEERIEAYQELQNELLKAQEAATQASEPADEQVEESAPEN